MINSMTGYGKGTAGTSEFTSEAEVKSINSRYLEIYLKLPPVLSVKEYELREFIRSKVKRGKLTVSLQLKKGGAENPDMAIDKEKLKSYLLMLKNIKKTAKLTEKFKLEHIVMNKDLFLSSDSDFSEKEFNVVKDSVNKALNQLLKMKKDEGNELAKDLKKRIEIIDEKLLLIEEDYKTGAEEHFAKLKERIKLLLEDSQVNSERLELELALIVDRSEITEECVRLRSHLKFFSESILKDEEPGRKLNFLCQEMNRETNTISSKSLSTSVTHNAVLIKEEIEKIREQIQNIE